MGENGFSFSPISRQFLSFLLFLGPKSVCKWEKTFSPISRDDLGAKVSRNGNDLKSVTHAGPEQPFGCLDDK